MLENQYAVQCRTLLLGTLVFSCSPQTQFPFILASRNPYQPQACSAISRRRARSNHSPLPPAMLPIPEKLAVHASRGAEQPGLTATGLFLPIPGRIVNRAIN